MQLETPRLTLVLLTPEELEQMIASMSEADRAQMTPEWLASMRAEKVANPWKHGFRILIKDTDVVVGNCAFKGPPVDGAVEIAYGLDPEHEGRGFATEAARALVEFASTQAEVRLICAHTLPKGEASKRVLTKSGFRYVGEVIDPADGTVARFELVPQRVGSQARSS